jgi:hypothetical protein
VTGFVAVTDPAGPPVPLFPHVPGTVLIAVATELSALGVDAHTPFVVTLARSEPPQFTPEYTLMEPVHVAVVAVHVHVEHVRVSVSLA